MPTATATDLAWWCLSAAVLAAVVAVALGGAVVVLVRRIGELEADVGEAIADKTACPDQWRISALERYADGGMAAPRQRGRHTATAARTCSRYLRPRTGPAAAAVPGRPHLAPATPASRGCCPAPGPRPGRPGEAPPVGPVPGLRAGAAGPHRGHRRDGTSVCPRTSTDPRARRRTWCLVRRERRVVPALELAPRDRMTTAGPGGA